MLLPELELELELVLRSRSWDSLTQDSSALKASRVLRSGRSGGHAARTAACKDGKSEW